MKKIIIILVLLLTFANLFSQNDDKNNSALKILLSLNKQDKNNYNIKYLIGTNYYYSNKYQDAIEWLTKCLNNLGDDDAIKKNNKLAPFETYYILGKSYFYSYKFDKAIAMFNKYVKTVKPNYIKTTDVDRYTSFALNAKKMINTPVAISKTNLHNINSDNDDFKPLLNTIENVMIFTRKINDNYVIFLSKKTNNKWETPKQIKTFNKEDNFIASSLSADGSMLLLNKFENKHWQIYTSVFDGKNWSVPQKLSKNINNSSNNRDASVSVDGNKLYFASDRKGGYGKFDIYYSMRLPDGKWGEVINAGNEINTEFNETSPLIFQDNTLLYFSSDAYNSMGSTDIFKAKLGEDNFFKNVENLGYPINTIYNDQMGYVSIDYSKIYYSTYNDKHNKDIFKVELNKNPKKYLTVIESYIRKKSDNTKIKDITCDVYQKDNNKYIGTYKTNSNTGKITLVLKSGKKYILKSKNKKYQFIDYTFSVPNNTNYFEIHKSIKLDVIGTVK